MDTQEFIKDFVMGPVYSHYSVLDLENPGVNGPSRKSGFLKLDNIDALWPFMTYQKGYMFDFLLDALMLGSGGPMSSLIYQRHLPVASDSVPEFVSWG